MPPRSRKCIKSGKFFFRHQKNKILFYFIKKIIFFIKIKNIFIFLFSKLKNYRYEFFLFRLIDSINPLFWGLFETTDLGASPYVLASRSDSPESKISYIL